jgi:hypothetical protein
MGNLVEKEQDVVNNFENSNTRQDEKIDNNDK